MIKIRTIPTYGRDIQLDGMSRSHIAWDEVPYCRSGPILTGPI